MSLQTRIIAARAALFLSLSLVAAAASGDPPSEVVTATWPVTGGDPGGSRYSPLGDIHRGNVSRLEVAWVYRHGDVYDAERRPDAPARSAFESTPIIAEGRLVFSTPFGRVIALDPETGEELWVHDPQLDLDVYYVNGFVNRGVAYWRDVRASGPCAGRIFHATLDARLLAIDVATGRPCLQFGLGGAVDLHEGVTGLVHPTQHKMTSPPVVVGDVVVLGASLADGTHPQPWGGVRGFDARSGRLLWRFNTIPQEGEFGSESWEGESWRRGSGANAWAPLSADPERGLVFVPTSTAGPDFWGGDRPGDNLFADSLLVLKAATGERLWHFQMVHHDLWDYDVASPPNLVTLERDGRAVDAVAQLTKTGFVFVFERETGEPFFPIEERPVPQSDLPGEKTSPTQPFPTRPPPLVGTLFDESDFWDRGPLHLEACREWLGRLRNEGIFTPPSFEGSVFRPSAGGGANWPGGAFDPERGRLFVPVIDVALVLSAQPGAPGPASPLARVWRWIRGGVERPARPTIHFDRFEIDGDTCKAPPNGYLVAVDLNRGEILWRVPTGRDDEAVGLASMAPPLVTAGDLVFHAGTPELVLRAHDVETGEVLARFEVPAGVHAGPITYKLRPDSPQFLVVGAGGHFILGRITNSPLGDYVIGYRLPE